MIIKELEIPQNWELVTISKIANVVGGGTPDTKNENYWNGDILWATPTDITNLKGKFISNTNRKISSQGLKNSSTKILPPFSLLLTSRASIGFCAINEKEICTNQGFQNIIPNEKIDIEFLYYMMHNYNVQKQLMRKAYGSTFLEIPNKDVKKVKILLPPLKEQRKIAFIFANVDELSFQTQKIIDHLRLLKKGLMQRLFTQGIGHTEFKETKLGRIPKEWEIKILEQVISMINSGTWGDAPNENKEVFPILRSTEIKHDGRIDLSTVEYRVVNSNNLKKYILEDNDILIVSSSGSPRLVGRTSFFIKPNKENIYLFSNFMLRIRPKLINPKYIYYYLNSGRYKRFINSIQQTATGLRNLPKGHLIKLKVPYPETKEQDKITEILTNVDIKIEQELEYQSKLKETKKGLMHDLLTGKRRVILE